jgi:predicted MFS family arabinose efflux permease
MRCGDEHDTVVCNPPAVASQSDHDRIIFRAFQGLGGAGIYSLAMRAITEIPSQKTMGPVAGLIGVVFACSSIAGPLLGGAIVSSSSWRWVFYLKYVEFDARK